MQPVQYTHLLVKNTRKEEDDLNGLARYHNWGNPTGNLRSGVIFFFFDSLLLWFQKEKNNALLPKTDYRDKGRGYDRRLPDRLNNCWFASDVMATMLVVKNKNTSIFWELNYIFM